VDIRTQPSKYHLPPGATHLQPQDAVTASSRKYPNWVTQAFAPNYVPFIVHWCIYLI